MKKVKSILCLALVLVLAFSMFACKKSDEPGTSTPGTSTPGTSTPGTSTPGTSTPGTAPSTDEYVSLTIGVDNFLGRFLAGINPAESWTGCDGVFNTTFQADLSNMQTYSTILEDWYYEDDEGTKMIMKLKENIVFSNGEGATAEDLLFSYTNHKDRGSNYLNNFGLILEECVVVDDYTVRFVFEKPFPAFTNSGFYLLDKSWSESVGWDSMEWYKPVASGLYYVDEWVADSHMVLKAREDYWNKDEVGEIYVDEWIIRYYPDPSTLYMALEIGDVDIASNVAATDFGRFVKNGGDGFECMLQQAGSVLVFCFGFQDLPDTWEDIRIRQAIAYAVKWEELGMMAMGDMYMPAYSVASSKSADYVKMGSYEYNPDRSRELFAELGYTESNKLKLSTVMMDSQMYKNVCEGFKFYADQLGVLDVTIEHQDTSSALGVWLSPGGNDFGFWYSVSGSPTGEVRVAVGESADPSGVTWDYVPFEDYLEIYARLANSMDPAVRSQAGKEVQQYMYENYIYIPVAEWTYAVGWRTDKISEQQMKLYNRSTNNMIISRLGLASAWQ